MASQPLSRTILVLMAAWIASVAPAQAQSPDVRITSPAAVGPNKGRIDVDRFVAGDQVARRWPPGEFEIDIKVYGATDAVAFHANVLYDPSAVSFVGLVGPGMFGLDGFPFVCDCDPAPPCGPLIPGCVRVNTSINPCAGAGSGVFGNGTLVTLRFASVAPHTRQSGFDLANVEFWSPGPPFPCPPPTPLNFDASEAKAVVVIGDATISCLNVNVTNDLDAINLPAGNPRCNSAPGNGDISLRSAIKIANEVNGGNHPTFRIPMADPTISVAAGSALTDSTGGTFLDGATQPLGTVHVDGPAGVPAMSLLSDGNIVKKLAFINSGIGLTISGSSNSVIGSRFGIRSNDVAAANVNGITITGGSDNIIGGLAAADANVISSNSNSGLVISGGLDAQVRGNKIGTNGAGMAARPNTLRGVLINGSTSTTIGGTLAGARNLISGNNGDGVEITGTSGHFVQGNDIGTDNTGNGPLGNAGAGVYLTGAADNTIGGTTVSARNVISDNGADGIEIALATSTGNMVQGNYLGLGANGNALLGNLLAGVFLNGAPSNTIGGSGAGARNVISDNVTDGVFIDLAAAANNSVINNAIGINAAGTLAAGNGRDGVRMSGGAHDNFIGGSGGFAVVGNEIVGNAGDGVSVIGGDDNEILDNAIGQTFAGLDLPNGGNGVSLTAGAANNTVESNSIHANGINGVLISGAGTNLNDILQNFIGEHDHGNDLNGVLITLGAQMNHLSLNNIEENGSPGSPPVGSGIEISGPGSDGNIVVANGIGANLASGVLIADGPAANEIGGDIPEAGNIISGNFVSGVFLTGAVLNKIQRNTIHDNSLSGITVVSLSGNLISRNIIHDNFPAAGIPATGLGIDLTAPGMTANDSGDADAGGNNSQNFPVITSAAGSVLTGSLDSTPGNTFTLEFFASGACDPSGHGEAETYLGAMTVVTDGAGLVPFTFLATPAPALGAFITATATDITPSPLLPANNTSEFSACVVATAGPLPCPADIAPPGGDGVVNVVDLLAVISVWGTCSIPCPPSCVADIAPDGGDCMVNIADLLAVISAWGSCP